MLYSCCHVAKLTSRVLTRRREATENMLDEIDTRTRAARPRERRARDRKRRLVLVAVLVGLFAATGTHAGVFPKGGGFEAATDTAQEYTPPSVGKTRAPALETTQGLVAARSSEPARAPENRPAPREPLDVLVLGVDRRPGAAEGSVSRSDTMMLVRVSPETGRIKLLSLPRDLLVEVAPGTEDRINTAYALDGVEGATAAVEGITGVSIDRHAIVDFGGFEDVIDALGGVTLEVGQPIRLGIEGRRVRIPAGRQELDGLEALAYARYRGTACADLDRIRRQQRLVAALREQALGWDTITKLPRIVEVAHENVDTDLGIVQSISLGRALVGRGGDGGTSSYQLKGRPETLPNGNQVLIPKERSNERILESFRNEGSTKSATQGKGPREGDAASGC